MGRGRETVRLVSVTGTMGTRPRIRALSTNLLLHVWRPLLIRARIEASRSEAS